MLEANKYFYAWNDLELRDVDGGITTGHMCNVCYAIVPWFHFDGHIEWHTKEGHDVELSDGI